MDEKKTTVSSQKKGTSKNKKKGIIAVVLVMALVIGATLAYLGTRSNEERNVFKGSNDINLRLTEPAWHTTQPYQNEKEEERAKSYTPNGVYKKDPKLTNNTNVSTDADKYAEWVAIRVDFRMEINGTVQVATWGGIKALVDIEDNNGNPYMDGNGENAKNVITNPNGKWFLIESGTVATDGTKTPNASVGLTDSDNYAIYMYQETLAVNSTTDPLFEQIHVKTQQTLVGSTYPNGKPHLPEFHIDVVGAAIKNESYTDASGTALATQYSQLNSRSTEQTNIKNELIGLLKVGRTTNP